MVNIDKKEHEETYERQKEKRRGSKVHFEPQLGELAREIVEVDLAGRRLGKKGGRQIDFFVDLIVERRAEVQSLPAKALQRQASVGPVVVRLHAEHQRQRQAIGDRRGRGDNRRILPGLPGKPRAVRRVKDVDGAIKSAIGGYDVGDGAKGQVEVGVTLPGGCDRNPIRAQRSGSPESAKLRFGE